MQSVWLQRTGSGSLCERVACIANWLIVLEEMMERRNRCYVPGIPNGVYLYKAQVKVDGEWVSMPLAKLVILR
ncbi:hypothetical protein KAX17_11980 [Candidatus Bipolaricaulota bacterium]|nr:hypothetical protein [Candidatus Bipolaricaulota bacterium]